MARTKGRGRGRATHQLLKQAALEDEPTFHPLKELDRLQYMQALTWYGNICSVDDAKSYAEHYLRARSRDLEADQIPLIPDDWFPNQVGWMARLVMRGARLSESSLSTIDRLLIEAFKRIPPPKPERIDLRSVVDKVRDKAGVLIGDLEGEIDDNGHSKDFNVYDWLQQKQVAGVMIPFIKKHFEPIEKEISEAYRARIVGVKKIDPQLIEGYESYTKEQLKKIKQFYGQLLSDVSNYVDNTKKQRKPRKKKVVAPEKKLKGFKYLPEYGDLKLASVNPEKVIGAEELWMFNTRNKVLTILKKGYNLIDVKGTTLTNYDESTSKSYKTGRKTEALCKDLQQANRRSLPKLVEKLNPTPLQTRSTDTTILMRVF